MTEHGGSRAGVLTVGELVLHSGLGLSAATGDVGFGRAIKGIHFSDAPDPVPYLSSQFVLVVTGRGFAADAEAGLRLLDRLATIDTTALAISTGHFVDSVPPEMVARARELKMPILEIPQGVLSRTVFSYVYHALASGDLHRLRRTVAMQSDLLDLLIADAGVDEVLAKVSTLIGMPMLSLDGVGRVVGSHGVSDPGRMASVAWRAFGELAGSAMPMGIVESGEARFVCREVILHGKLERLLVASASQASSSEFVDTALSFLQRLATLNLLRRRDEIVATQRLRQRLLRDLLAGTASPEELTEWVAEHGLDLSQRWRVAVCDLSASPQAPRRRAGELEDALVEAVDTFFGDRLIPFLSRPQRMSITILLPDGSPSARVGTARDLLLGLRTFAAQEPYRLALTIGCSDVRSDPQEGPRALQEALDATSAARRGIEAGGLVLFGEMSGRFRLLEGQSDEALADIARRTIAPLMEYDARRRTQLVLTLRTLLDNHWAIQPTAEALFIHRNTLQKRMRRIGTLLDMDLTDVDDLMELYLGLRASQLLGEAGIVVRAPARPHRPTPIVRRSSST
jgi:purine catabolism regulator